MPINYNKRPSQPPQPPQPPAAPPSAPPSAPPAGGGYPPPAPGGYPPPAAPAPGGYPPPGAPAPAGQPPVSLSKVTLTKQAPSVSLTKQTGAGGILRVNLNWTQRQGGGFFKRLAGGGDVDLDLGCLYEFADGDKAVVQALGNAFQAFQYQGDRPVGNPIIWLDGDDRSGKNTGGENMHIDLGRMDFIRRILVFAYIYEGTPNWAAANAVATLYPVNGPQIEVNLDEHDPQAPMCAIALLTNQNGQLTINREVRYIRGAQRILDQTYGWGLNWSPGRK